jgi:hypothetical protein
MPEHPLSHIEFARRYCVIRDAPLAPKHDPIATAQMLIDSQIVQQMAPEARKICIDDIKTQATLMIPEQRRKEGSSNKNVRWIEHWEQSQDRPLKWDEVRGFVESQQTPN